MKSALACAVFALLLDVRAHAETTAMGGSMKKMEEATKQLDADLKQTDATKHDKTADLQSVATIKKECLEAKNEVPKKAKALPTDQQQAMTTDFQKSMDTFITHVDQLNTDITAEKWDVASTDFKALVQEQYADHKLYRVKK